MSILTLLTEYSGCPYILVCVNLVLATLLRFQNAPFKIKSQKVDFLIVVFSIKLCVRIPITGVIYFS